MQKIITSLLFTLFFNTGIFAQQSFQVEYGFAIGTQKAADSWSLAWYRNDALKSGHVLRVNYDKSLMGDDYREMKSRSLQMDVTKRWHNSLDKKIRFYLESGISGMAISSTNEWNGFNVFDCFYCPSGIGGNGLFTEENSLMLYNHNTNQYAFNVMPGITIGGGLDIDLGKSFYMGTYYRLNTYYWLSGGKTFYYLRYGLNAGWKF